MASTSGQPRSRTLTAQKGPGMITRSLTSKFMQYRSTASHRRDASHSWGGPRNDDSSETDDNSKLLIGRSDEGSSKDTALNVAPAWVDIVEQVHYNFNGIRQRMKDLWPLHDKHINQPGLDDDVEREQEIEIMTKDITSKIQASKKDITSIGDMAKKSGKPAEFKMCKNVMSALAAELQELSQEFRKGQHHYLNRMRGREEKSRGIFVEEEDASYDKADEYYDPGWDQTQQQELERNTREIEERELEITRIVRSIHELHEIFKEVAALIIDQGTILDNIEHNIDVTETLVEEGHGELVAADKYQRRSRKCLFILLLVVAIIVVVIILIVRKS
eukprot:Opistho-2@50540